MHITERNFDYFVEGLPYLDGIKMMIMPEEVTKVSALRNGDFDLAKIGEPLSLIRCRQIDSKYLELRF